jgi:hypothetical protein
MERELIMNLKNSGFALIIIGAGITIISLIADVIGLGGDPSVIGWKQIIGIVVGAVIIIVGLWTTLKARKKNA